MANRKPITDAQRASRRAYRQQPEVKYKMAIRRAVKAHKAMPTPSFKPGKPPVGRG